MHENLQLLEPSAVYCLPRQDLIIHQPRVEFTVRRGLAPRFCVLQSCQSVAVRNVLIELSSFSKAASVLYPCAAMQVDQMLLHRAAAVLFRACERCVTSSMHRAMHVFVLT
jgi:hypothetical protein